MTAFHHLHHAALDQIGGRQVFNPFAAQLDTALGHLATLALEQVGDGPQRGRLASTVATQNGHDAAFGHLQRDALEHQDHVVVDDLDAVDVENNVFRVHGVAFAVPIEKIAMQPFRLAAAQKSSRFVTGP